MTTPHFSTKERILNAAEALFAQHGFAGTSLRLVTGRADVNLAAVNYHFGSKENLVAEVFRQSPPDSAFARLAVRPLRAAGLDGIWQSRRAEIVAAAGGDPTYATWLARAEAAK